MDILVTSEKNWKFLFVTETWNDKKSYVKEISIFLMEIQITYSLMMRNLHASFK